VPFVGARGDGRASRVAETIGCVAAMESAMRLRPMVISGLLWWSSCAMVPPGDRQALPGITVAPVNGSQSEAEARAPQYCAEYGARARREKVNEGTTETFLSYSCN
jgi:hypothetical protein